LNRGGHIVRSRALGDPDESALSADHGTHTMRPSCVDCLFWSEEDWTSSPERSVD